ncbi:MAG: murI [Chlamydiia bacterium]|nr:murI [Chlamydiia bacterium]
MAISIGMFDSGVGGLTVLREVERLLPDDSFVYFGDTAHCPYGPKGDKTIIRYSIENSIFLIDQGIDLLVVACHTASALSLHKLKSTFSIPVLGVIEPAVQKACTATHSKRIGVIGTRATIQSNVYQKAIHAHLEHAHVFAQACPLFVPLIEEQFGNREIARLIVREYLLPLKEHNIDTLLLGCTHYPLLHTLIQEEIGSDVVIVNPATACAEAVAQIKKTLLHLKKEVEEPLRNQRKVFFVSDDPVRFKETGERFFGYPLPDVIHVSPTNSLI